MVTQRVVRLPAVIHRLPLIQLNRGRAVQPPTTIGSHERIGVFRIFGRDAGFTALYTAFTTASRCVIPEYRYDMQHLADLLAEDHASNRSHYAIVITSEGAVWEGGEIGEVGEPDAFGHRHKANVSEILSSEIKALTGIDTIHSDLTYDLRAGEPDTVDTFVSITFASIAVELIANPSISASGMPSLSAMVSRNVPVPAAHLAFMR